MRETFHGAADTYTLARAPADLEVFLNGLLQDEGGDYTVVGSTITFKLQLANPETIVKVRYTTP